MKKWIKPQLTVLTRTREESVMRCCKSFGYSGPQLANCSTTFTPCKDLKGS